ncbi:hypothetical protein [Tychonema sp. BBK16]|nr:hypothetical protein [Tychonema sp. BBK16]MCF6372144.1 hypothetical protein [Tychonema sp. BBK16]
MKVYHFFVMVATGKEMGAIGGDKLRFRTYGLRRRNRVFTESVDKNQVFS